MTTVIIVVSAVRHTRNSGRPDKLYLDRAKGEQLSLHDAYPGPPM